MHPLLKITGLGLALGAGFAYSAVAQTGAPKQGGTTSTGGNEISTTNDSIPGNVGSDEVGNNNQNPADEYNYDRSAEDYGRYNKTYSTYRSRFDELRDSSESLADYMRDEDARGRTNQGKGTANFDQPGDEYGPENAPNQWRDLDYRYRDLDYDWRRSDAYWRSPDRANDPKREEYWRSSDEYWNSSRDYWRNRYDTSRFWDDYAGAKSLTNQGKGNTPRAGADKDADQ